MAEWQRWIDVKDVWNTHDIPFIAKTLSERLKVLEPFGDARIDDWRDELADRFADLAAEANPTADDFDSVMSDLYDWADTPLDNKVLGGRKVCWIATF